VNVCLSATLSLCLVRLFLSAEPPPALERGLPISLLQNSIKLTNEPPEGLRPNLRRAYNQFNEEILESCAKQVCGGSHHSHGGSAGGSTLLSASPLTTTGAATAVCTVLVLVLAWLL